MKTMVEIRNLTYEYGSQAQNSLKIDDLTVTAGSTLALLGPSGAGKTTTLRLIAGLLETHVGSISIDGKVVTNVLPERRRVGMVFQQPLLFPFNSVVDNVGFAARTAGKRRTKAREEALLYLDLVGLSHLSQRDVRTLSGGQAQRVALARALAATPLVLLLDEPFSALDVDLRSEMQEMLQQVRKALDLTIILVTHDQREAAILADSVALISNGQILQTGQISDFYSHPSSREVHRMMGGKNEVAGVVINGGFHSALGVMELPPQKVNRGPALMLLRQESIQIEPETSKFHRDGSVVARVTESRSLGARVELTLEVRGGIIRAEVAQSTAPNIGDEITLHIPFESRWVVPTNDEPNISEYPFGLIPGSAALSDQLLI